MIRKFVITWMSLIILKIIDGHSLATFRQLEKLWIKKTKILCHLDFNITCNNCDLLPIYTNVKTHNPSARDDKHVKKFRKELLINEIEKLKKDLINISESIKDLKVRLKEQLNSNIKYESAVKFIERLQQSHKINLDLKHSKKLHELYSAKVPLIQTKNNTINLSSFHIDEETINILQMGLNCHLKSKFKHNNKLIEIEKLYNSINNHVSNDKIEIDNIDYFKTKLKHFGIQNKRDFSKDVLSKDEYKKLKTLTQNKELTIRKADKSNTIVIVDTSTYLQKIDHILSDASKFKKLNKNPVQKLKNDLNKTITAINAVKNNLGFSKLIGNYNAGYIYANPKTHKNQTNPPYRPIISQIGTPTYEIAKNINRIIAPYLDKQYMVESSYDLINILKTINTNYKLASIDVENLFTNVPVHQTTDIIINRVFHHPSMPPPKNLSPNILKDLLITCTTKTPFTTPDNKIYQQIDGVSMGSPLGPVYANFYMSHIENMIIPNLDEPPLTYMRYVDDTLLLVKNYKQLDMMIASFKNNSVLNFTSEIEKDNQINFLDINIKKKNNKFSTSVFKKPTSSDDYINFKGCCPEQYKIGVIKTLLHRAYHLSSDYFLLHNEINGIKQALINNHFPIQLIDRTIKNFLINLSLCLYACVVFVQSFDKEC